MFAIPHLSPSSDGCRFHVSCQSAGYYDGNFANIAVNGHYVVRGGERGFNLLVISTEDGTILKNVHFDSFVSLDDSDNLAKLLSSREDECVVVLSVKDEATRHLTEALKQAITNLGSL